MLRGRGPASHWHGGVQGEGLGAGWAWPIRLEVAGGPDKGVNRAASIGPQAGNTGVMQVNGETGGP